MTTKPTITVLLTLHPQARDGQRNAWKIEMSGPNGQPLFVETAGAAAALLDRASDYMASAWSGYDEVAYIRDPDHPDRLPTAYSI